MVRFELSVDIDRPLHEVWEYLTDPERVPEWQSSAQSSHQVSDGPMRVGTRWQEVRRFVGKKVEMVMELTDYEPNRSSSLKSISGPVPLAVEPEP